MSRSQDLLPLQALLLKWLRHHRSRSIGQIREASKDLLNTFNIEDNNPLFKTLYPLFRRGLVEYVQSGIFQVSTPVVLYYSESSAAVCVNLYEEQKQILIEHVEGFDEDIFGVVRARIAKNHITKFCQKSACKFLQPKIPHVLSYFPTINNAVSKFERAFIVSGKGEYFNIKTHRWETETQEEGLFRLSNDAQKIYLKTANHILEVPDFKVNPEGRPLAECYLAIRNDYKFLHYNDTTEELSVSNITIPILLERVLRVASLNIKDGVREENRTTSFSKITSPMIKEIHRIFAK